MLYLEFWSSSSLKNVRFRAFDVSYKSILHIFCHASMLICVKVCKYVENNKLVRYQKIYILFSHINILKHSIFQVSMLKYFSRCDQISGHKNASSKKDKCFFGRTRFNQRTCSKDVFLKRRSVNCKNDLVFDLISREGMHLHGH